MNSLLQKNLISTKEASVLSGYNADYLSRLCREKKIVSSQVGRTWLIERASLEIFIETQLDRKIELAENLARERELEYRKANSSVTKVSDVATSLENKMREAASSMLGAFSTVRIPRSAPIVSGRAFAAGLTAIILGLSVTLAGSGVVAHAGEMLLASAFKTRALVVAALSTSNSLAIGRTAEFSRIAQDEIEKIDTTLARAVDTRVALLPTRLGEVIEDTHEPVAMTELAYTRARDIFETYPEPITPTQTVGGITRAVMHPEEVLASIAREALFAYNRLGAYALNDIQTVMALHLYGIEATANGLLTVSENTRVIARQTPLAIGNVFVRGSSAILSSYERAVYAYVENIDVVPSAVTGTVYGLGSGISSSVAMGVQTAPLVYEESVLAFVEESVSAGSLISEGSFAFGREADRTVSGLLEAQDRAIVQSVEGTKLALTSVGNGAASAVLAIESVPPLATDKVLGVAGNIALRIERVDASVLSASPLVSLDIDRFIPGFLQNITAVLAHAVGSAFHGVFGPLAGFFGASEEVGLAVIPNEGSSFSGPSGETSIEEAVKGNTTVYNGPVTIVRNEYPTVNYSGVSQAYVDERLALLRRTLYARVVDRTSDTIYGEIRDADVIDSRITGSTFANGAITDSTFTGGTITGASLNVASTTVTGSLTVSGDIAANGITATSSVITNATSTNLFATGASFTNLLGGNATITNATSTNFYAAVARVVDGFFTNLTTTLATITNAVITNLTATNSTLTNATTTNATTTGSLALTYLTPSRLLSVGANGIATSTILSSWVTGTLNQLTVTDNGTGGVTLSLPSVIAIGSSQPTTIRSDGATSTFGGGIQASIVEGGQYIAGPYVLATSTTATSAFSGNIAVGRNATFGTSASDLLTVNSSISSNLIPTTNNTYDLGSTASYWRRGYVDELVVNNLSAASSSIAGTVSNSFTINTDNATNDTEDITLIFKRGSASPNALMTWNSSSDRFEFNMPVFSADGLFTSATTTNFGTTNFTLNSNTFTSLLGTGLSNVGGALTVNYSALETDFFRQGGNSFGTTATLGTNDAQSLAFETGGSTRMTILSGGNVGIGTSSPSEALGVTGNIITSVIDGGGLKIGSGFRVGVDNSTQATLAYGLSGGFRIVDPVNGKVPFTIVQNPLNGAMSIGANGVGFATSSPAAYVHVDAAGSGRQGVRISSTIVTSGTHQLLLEDTDQADGSTPFWHAYSNNGNFSVASANRSGLSPTGAAVRMTIDTSGNVGIGTTTPGAKLDVFGNLNIGTGAANSVLSFNDANSANYYRTITDTGTGLQISNNEGGGSVLGLVGLSGGTEYFTTTNVDIINFNSGQFYLQQSSGNVGIGTTSPYAKLSVVGQTVSEYFTATSTTATSTFPNLSLTNFGIGGSSFSSLLGNGLSNVGGTLTVSTSSLSSGFFLQGGNSFGATATLGTNDSNNLAFETGGSTRLTIDTSGNVGVGTTTPSARLSVATNGATTGLTVQSSQGVTGGALAFGSLSNGGRIQAFANDSIATAATANLLLNASGGNVGIGTTTPGDALHVARGGGAGIRLDDSNTSTGGYLRMTHIGNNTQFTSYNIAGSALSVPMYFQGSTGNVGIGVTSPLAKLDISSAASTQFTPTLSVRGAANSTSNSLEWGHTNSAGYGSTLGFYSSAGNPYIAFSGQAGTTVNTFRTQGIKSSIILSDLAGGMQFGNVATAAATDNQSFVPLVTILNGGNVGIGVSNPTTGRLQVAGASGAWTGYLVGNSATSNSYGLLIDAGTNSSDSAFRIRSYAGADYMHVRGDGRIGIGTTTPSYKLSFGSAGDSIGVDLTGGGSTRTSVVELYNSSTGAFSVKTHNQSTGGIEFWTQGTQRLTVDRNGNVGVGTTSPQTKLHVNGGDATVTNSSANPAYYLGESDLLTAGTYGYMTWDRTSDLLQLGTQSAGPTITMDESGNVGIGSTTPAYTLGVTGTIGATGTITGYATGQTFRGVNGGTSAMSTRLTNTGADTYFGTEGSSAGGFFTGSLAYSSVIYSSTAIQNIIGGVSRMLIDTSGNVGIGTTNPGAKLDVTGNTSVSTSDYYGASTWTGKLSASSANTQAGLVLRANASNGNPALASIHAVPIAEYRSGLVATYSGDGSGSGYFAVNQFLPTSSATLERLRVDVNGNVGIGTTSPQSKLDVYNASASTLTVSTDGASTNVPKLSLSRNNASTWSLSQPSGAYDFTIDQDGTRRVTIQTSTGNVGIGTTTPSSILSISGSSAAFSITDTRDNTFSVGDVISSIDFRSNDASNSLTGAIRAKIGTVTEDIYNTYTGLAFSTHNGTTLSEKLRITNAGNVGIGTTSPAAKLDVYSTTVAGIAVTGNNPAYATVDLKNTSGTTSFGLRAGITSVSNGGFSIYDSVAATSRLVITDAGNVGIGTTSPGTNLDVNGSGRFTSYTTPSAGTGIEIAYDSSFPAGRIFAIDRGASAFKDLRIDATNLILNVGSGGNVGVGTAVPGSRLQVSTNNSEYLPSTSAFSIRKNEEGYGLFAGVSGSGNGWLQAGTADNATNYNLILQSRGGNVGIGNSSPATRLHVVGGGVVVNTTGGAGTSIGRHINLGSVTTPTDWRSYTGNTTAAIQMENSATEGFVLAATQGAAVPRTQFITTGGFEIQVGATIGSSGTNALQILSSGNVGVGTTTPLSKLQVSVTGADAYGLDLLSSTSHDTGIRIGRGTGANGAGIQMVTAATDYLSFYVNGSALPAINTAAQMVLTEGGNVGIGTTTPATKLELAGVTVPALTLSPSNYGGSYRTVLGVQAGAQGVLILGNNGSNEIRFGNTATGGTGSIYVNNTADYTSATNGTLAMHFTAAGNVGIGDTTPDAKLDILQTSDAAAQGLQISRSNDSDFMRMYMSAGVGSLSDTLIFSSAFAGDVAAIGRDGSGYFAGNMGIGTSTPVSKLSVYQSSGAGRTLAEFSNGNRDRMLQVVHDISGDSTSYIGLNAREYGSTGGRDFVLQTGGTERMRVAYSTGYVGIGPTTPLSKLHVSATAAASMTLGSPTGVGFTVSPTGGGYGLNMGANSDGKSWIQGGRIDGTATAYDISLQASGGKVGIGTTGPGYKLDVAGDMQINNIWQFHSNGQFNWGAGYGNGTLTWDTGYAKIHAQGTNALKLYSANTGTGIDVVSTGYVGINDTTPEYMLDVQAGTGNVMLRSSSDAPLLISGTDTWAGIGFYDSNGSDFIWYNGSGDSFAIGGGGTTVNRLGVHGNMTVGTNFYNIAAPSNGMIVEGNVGIGITGPLGLLQVNGTSAGAKVNNLVLSNSDATSGAGTTIYMGYQAGGLGAYGARIAQTGNPGGTRRANLYLQLHNDATAANDDTGWDSVISLIGGSTNFVGINMTGPSVALDVTGDIEYTGTITDVSDRRLKENIQDIENPFSVLSALDAKTYNMIGNSRPEVGFLAQDVQAVLPNTAKVVDPVNGYLGVSYMDFIPYLVEGVNELNIRTLSIAPAAQNQEAHSLAVSSNASIAGILTVTGTGTFSGSLTAASILTEGSVTALSFLAEANETLPSEVLTGGSADLFKMASYAITGIQALSERTDLLATRLDDIDARVTALENGSTADEISGAVGLTVATIKSALQTLGIYLENGVAQFETLVFRQLAVAKDTNGDSSAGSETILAGNTVVEVENPYVLPTSKIFVTFTGPIQGAWYISNKEEGKFRVTLADGQSADVSFDYFILQTEGQLASPGAAAPIQTPNEPIPSNDPLLPVFPGEGTGTTTPVVGSGDTTPPTITLNGAAAREIDQGTTWIDEGAAASDETDGDLTGAIQVQGTVNTSTPGTYTVSYSVSDAAGNEAHVSRIVSVQSVSAPEPVPSAETEIPATESTPAP